MDAATVRPLAGRRVLVARSRAQASALADRVRDLGGDPVEAPVLRIEDGDVGSLRAALHDLADGAFAAVCLTSPNGVDAVASAIEQDGLDARVFAAVPLVACVGPGTAGRLWERLRVRADLVPDRATTEALGEALPHGSGRVLLPRADIASPILHQLVVDKGYEPLEVVAYRTVAPDTLPDAVLDDLEAGRIDLLAFASSSTVRNFVTLVGQRPWRGAVVSIGPVTTRTCRELDIPVAVEADPHDLDGLVAALVTAAGSDGS
ncbi:uroporphyrinogen-III synthase [Egicoccus sp. AB-alg6-2]|uniref:uroporphyrinogen-III synthase n=1 Tax=Egicoccus sp. AB-alg6-2 TaxID=3242692 RepID=UPI00359DA462